MKRVTTRVGENVQFADGQKYADLTKDELIKSLLQSLAECEDKLEGDVMAAYFKVEDFLYGTGKDKPMEIKAAMAWGALTAVHNLGAIDWDSARRVFGEFMSKQMNLR